MSAGMVSFTSAPMVVNGLFGVGKPDGSMRLIVDARPANACFRLPPKVRLPSPEVLGGLVMQEGRRVFTAKCDLDNFYHRLRVPAWLRPYFALPPVPRHQVAVDESESAGDNTEMLFPCLTALPMGWSHSVYLAQIAHEHIVYCKRTLCPGLSLSQESGRVWSPAIVRHP